MSCCNKEGLWKAIAVFSMMVSLFYLAASICGLLTYHCIFNPGVSKFHLDNFYLTYILYFYNYNCIDFDSNYIVFRTDTSERTWAIMIAYITVNTLWFVTSIMLFRAPHYWKSRTAQFLTYPWLFSTFSVLGLDLAASIIYGLDLENIWDLTKLVDFIKLSYPGLLADSKYFTYVPAATIIMVSLFSKFFIGWLLFLMSILYIFVSMIHSSRPGELVLQTRANVDYYAPPAYANPAFEMSESRTTHSSPRVLPQSDGYPLDEQYSRVPQILPRAKLNGHRQPQMRTRDNEEDPREGPASPRSILKTPNPTYYSYEIQTPWTYLPKSAAGQFQRQSSDSWSPQPSAPAHRENSQAMYY